MRSSMEMYFLHLVPHELPQQHTLLIFHHNIIISAVL